MTLLTRLTGLTGRWPASQAQLSRRPFPHFSIRSPGSGGPGVAQPPNAPARVWLPSLAVLGVVLVLAQIVPGLFLRLLGAPSAWLASLWLGGPMLADPDGYWILNARQAVHVTNACNGAGFFALLCALTVPYWHRGSNPARCGLLIAAPIAGAILANSARIIAVWYAARVTALLAIPAWAGTIHYISGLLVFFLFLVAYHISMERIHHE
jgi:exosortase/archaeosortase family protein